MICLLRYKQIHDYLETLNQEYLLFSGNYCLIELWYIGKFVFILVFFNLADPYNGSASNT